MAQLQRCQAHAQGWSRAWSQGRERGGAWWSLRAGTALSVGARGGRQDEPARRVPCSPSWPGLLTGCLGSPGRAPLWLTRDWGRAGTQERQEAEESTEPLRLASPEQSAGPAWTTHPLRGTQGPSVSFQGSCWPSQPRFPTPAPSSRSITLPASGLLPVEPLNSAPTTSASLVSISPAQAPGTDQPACLDSSRYSRLAAWPAHGLVPRRELPTLSCSRQLGL